MINTLKLIGAILTSPFVASVLFAAFGVLGWVLFFCSIFACSGCSLFQSDMTCAAYEISSMHLPGKCQEGQCAQYAVILSDELHRAGVANRIIYYDWTYKPNHDRGRHVYVEYTVRGKKWVVDNMSAPKEVSLDASERDEITVINGGSNPRLKIRAHVLPDEYDQPSDDTPESLKPFYDPDLTRALNQ